MTQEDQEIVLDLASVPLYEVFEMLDWVIDNLDSEQMMGLMTLMNNQLRHNLYRPMVRLQV